MPTRTYTINFKAIFAAALNGAKALRLELLAIEKQAVRTEAALRSMAGRIVASLKAIEVAAKAAGVGINGLGGHQAAMQVLDSSLKVVKKDLDAVKVSATGAGKAVGGIGRGGTRGAMGVGAGMMAGPAVGRGGKLDPAAVALGVGAAAGMVARDAVTTMGADATAAQSAFSDASKQATAYKGSLLGLSNLRGMETGPTDAMVRQQLQFSKETGLTADAARDFQLEFEGAIGGAMGAKNITPEVAKDLEKQLGIFAARYDLDPESAGRLGGILPLHKKITSGEEGAGIIAQMTEHLNLTGVGKVKTMIPAINQMSATMFDENGGRFTDPVQMAARYAATTLNSGGNPMVAKSMMERANKVFRGFSNPKVAAAMGEAGITLKDDYESAVRKMGVHFDKLKAQGIDPDQWMASHGIDSKFGGSVGRRDVISQVGLNKVVDAQNEDVRVKLKGTNVLEYNKAFFASDVGKERTLANQEFATSVETGLANNNIDAARRAIRADLSAIDPVTKRQRLKASGITSLIDRFVNFTTGKSGEDTRVDIEMMDRLDAAGRATGKWGYWNRPSDKMRWMDLDPEGMRNEYQTRAAEVRAAGGDPLTGGKLSQAAANAAKAMDNVARAARAAEGGRGGMVGPPQMGPAVDPKRR